MTQIFFSEDHEYAKIDGDIATIGITDYAQKALGDVVYAELPKVGQALAKGGQAGVVESVKSASEIYSPLSGTVTEINQALNDDPALINQDPLGKAWFYKLKLTNAGETASLKDEAGYKAYTESL